MNGKKKKQLMKAFQNNTEYMLDQIEKLRGKSLDDMDEKQVIRLGKKFYKQGKLKI